MNGSTVAMVLALIVAGVAGAPLSGVAHSVADVGHADAGAQTAAENETDDVPPGARLAGVLGAQEAEVTGDVDSRALSVAVERAESDDERARVVSRQVGELDERLDDLEERRRDLQREHREGNITTGTYVAELTELTARTESARGLANQSGAVARDLPPEAAASQGVDVTAIRALEGRAANLTGPEVAAIARSIAGDGVGRPATAGPPDGAGPPSSVQSPGNGSAGPPAHADDPANRSERGTGATNATGPVENVTDGVENAPTAVSNATGALGNATDGATGEAGGRP